MRFIFLLTDELYKKRETIKLKNFPAGYVCRFCRNLANNVDDLLRVIFLWKNY